MIVLGCNEIVYENIEYTKIEDIKNTKPNSTIIVNFTNKEDFHLLQKEDIPFAVIVNSIKEAIIANSYMAKYIISSGKLTNKLQKIADNYLFDSKIINIITNDKELEKSAIDGIDGVIFKNLLTN